MPESMLHPEPHLTRSISDAITALYASVYGHDDATATTYINDNVVVCFLTTAEDRTVAEGTTSEIAIGAGGVALQTDTQDEFTAAIERLTHRRVTAFLCADQTTPGVACELFFLDASPLAAVRGAAA